MSGWKATYRLILTDATCICLFSYLDILTIDHYKPVSYIQPRFNSLGKNKSILIWNVFDKLYIYQKTVENTFSLWVIISNCLIYMHVLDIFITEMGKKDQDRKKFKPRPSKAALELNRWRTSYPRIQDSSQDQPAAHCKSLFQIRK